MKTAVFVAGVVLIVATALPLVRTAEWWIRIFDFPRLHIAILLASTIGAFLIFYDPSNLLDGLFLCALAASLGYQLYRIFPYTSLAAEQVVRCDSRNASNCIRLLIANVLMHNRRIGDFLALVRAHDPDIVFAVETDDWWDRELAVLDRDYPYAVKRPQNNTYGMHLFSRLELDSPEIRFLVEDDVPSIRTAVRLRSGRWIDFHGLHPRPPKPGQDTQERDAEILIVGREVRANRSPSIVAGDLNDVAWSHTTRLFQRLSGTLDPRVGRGMFGTFHAKYPMFRWPLDHVFHDRSFTLGEMKRLGFFGSDHFPVLAELCLAREDAPLQQSPAADQEDIEETCEKIEEGKQGGE